nr:helix-turn-helix domain-containing protein [Mycobacterium riyadhense]
MFRYQLICPALDAGLSTKQRGKLVRQIAAGTHTDPFGNQVRVSRETLDRWIRRYRGGGFEALLPEPRRLAAARMRRCWSWRLPQTGKPDPHRHPGGSHPAHRHRVGALGVHPAAPFPPARADGTRAGEAPAVFGRFEAANPNELWVGDALHGRGSGTAKTYLFTFLDDHSRLASATGSAFLKTPCGWPPRCAPRWRPRVPAGSTWITAALSSMPGCCGHARNSVCAWSIHNPVDPKDGQDRTVFPHRARTVPG